MILVKKVFQSDDQTLLSTFCGLKSLSLHWNMIFRGSFNTVAVWLENIKTFCDNNL